MLILRNRCAAWRRAVVLFLSLPAAANAQLASFTPVSDAFRVNGSISDPEGPDDAANVATGQITSFSASGGGTTSTGPVRGSVAFSASITGDSSTTFIDLDGLGEAIRPAGNRSFLFIGISPDSNNGVEMIFTIASTLQFTFTHSGTNSPTITAITGQINGNMLSAGTYRINFFLGVTLESYEEGQTPTPDTQTRTIDSRLTLQPGGAVGACCCGSSCFNVASPGLCVSPGGGVPATFITTANCSPFSVVLPCCRANFNRNATPPFNTSQDIFDFLAAFFSTNSAIKRCADFNGNPPAAGTVTSQDIFDFLAAFFRPGGCTP